MQIDNIHNDTINSVETLSSSVFASASDDGTVNVSTMFIFILDLGHAHGVSSEDREFRR